MPGSGWVETTGVINCGHHEPKHIVVSLSYAKPSLLISGKPPSKNCPACISNQVRLDKPTEPYDRSSLGTPQVTEAVLTKNDCPTDGALVSSTASMIQPRPRSTS